VAPKSPPDIPVLYGTDCLQWADATVDVLRRRAVAELDWEHLIPALNSRSGVSTRFLITDSCPERG
jgi:hypothetical protein